MLEQITDSHLMKAVLYARDSSSPLTEAPEAEPANEQPAAPDDWESIKPAPIDPPDNTSLPGDPSVTRPDY